MKNILCVATLSVAGVALATAPEITLTATGQDSLTRAVTVTYTLANEPAVVTFVAQTNNGSAWIDIGNKNLSNFGGD